MSTFEAQETMKKYGPYDPLKPYLEFFMIFFGWDLCCEFDLAFCSTQLSTQAQTSPPNTNAM